MTGGTDRQVARWKGDQGGYALRTIRRDSDWQMIVSANFRGNIQKQYNLPISTD